MRYVVYGAGAVGGVIGAHLHLAGLPTTLVARGAHLEAVRRDGLVLETPVDEQRLDVTVAANAGDGAASLQAHLRRLRDAAVRPPGARPSASPRTCAAPVSSRRRAPTSWPASTAS